MKDLITCDVDGGCDEIDMMTCRVTESSRKTRKLTPRCSIQSSGSEAGPYPLKEGEPEKKREGGYPCTRVCPTHSEAGFPQMTGGRQRSLSAEDTTCESEKAVMNLIDEPG